MAVKTFQEFVKIFLCAIIIFYLEETEENLKIKEVPQNELLSLYDFIIVGGGSAGCVLAHRLTEVQDWTVLVIEAGGDETALSNTPFLWSFAPRTDLDWNYTTVRQKRACGEYSGVCQLIRGHVLGGSSSINGMMYIRGNRKDFDDWERMGNPGWNYKEALRYFKKSENAKEEELISSPYHATGGPVSVQYPVFSVEELRDDFVKAGEELGYKHTDYNGATQNQAIGRIQFTINGPSRQGAVKGFLRPVQNRKNLAVIKRSYCLKVLIENKTAVGVEYERNGKKYRVRAKKEVILSAGATNSPKILMLSGIGPRAELKNLGIKVVNNKPVGRNLHDHISAILYFELSENATITKDVWMSNETILEYARDRRGPLTNVGFEVVAFNNPNNSRAPPTISYLFGNSAAFLLSNKQIIYIYVALIEPKSLGTLKLKSMDPYDAPLIDPNYFAVRDDYDTLYKGLEGVFDFMETSSMQKYAPKHTTEFQSMCSGFSRKEFIHCLLTLYSLSFYHQVGTVKMGPETDRHAVVDTSLRVRGISHLRVIDGSIIPKIPKCHLRSPITMIAEKASDIIKQQHRT